MSRTTVIGAARTRWTRAAAELDTAGLTDAQRAALSPVLRHRAMLQAAVATGNFPRPLRMVLGIALLATLVGVPIAVARSIGTEPRSWTVVYLWYLALLPVATALYWSAFLGLFLLFGRWSRHLARGAATAVALGLLVPCLVWDATYARARPASVHIVLLAAFVAAVLVLYLLAALRAALAYGRRSRSGTLSPAQAAAVLCYDQRMLLVRCRARWRRPAVRRTLVRGLARAASDAFAYLDDSVRLCGGDRQARDWAAGRAWHVGQALRSHQRALILARARGSYEQIIDGLAQQAADLATGSWDAVEQPTGPPPSVGVRRLLDRYGPAAVLVGLALILPYLPGLGGTDLSAIRLGLLLPAVLSLAPFAASGRDLVIGSVQGALGGNGGGKA